MEYNMQQVFDFQIENWDELWNTSIRFCRKRFDLVEEMFFDVALPKVENAFRTYDVAKSNGASIKTHVMRTVAWYCCKFMDRRLKVVTRERTFSDCENDETELQKVQLLPCKTSEKEFETFETRERINRLLGKLTEEQRRFLYLHTGKGQTFFEIGELVGKSASYVRVQHDRALKFLQSQVANEGVE